MKTDIVEVLW